MDEDTDSNMENYFIVTARHLDRDDSDQPEPFRVEADILWKDFQAVVKAQYEDPPNDVIIKYSDEDNEMISMTTQDELFEAMGLARSVGGIIQLEVKCVPKQQEYTVINQIDTTLILPAIPRRKISPIPPAITINSSEQNSVPEMAEAADTAETGELSPKSKRDQETGLFIEKTMESGKDECVDTDSSVPADSQSDYERMSGSNIPDNTTDSMPYPAFVEFMEKLKQELRSEIVHDVTKKTVKQVLRGLDHSPVSRLDRGPWGSKKEDIRHAHPVYLHEGIMCKHCQKTILGVRYRCGNCQDYDLCEKCESKYGLHNPDHVFIKLRRPCRDIYRDSKKTPLLKRVLYKVEAPEPFERVMERKQEKMKKKVEKMFEKEKRKEEKLKRKLEKYDGLKDSPKKRERYEIQHQPLLQHIHFCNKEYKTLGAAFVRDITIPDGTTVQPGTRMFKTWRLLNTGSCAWRETTMLRLMYGTIPAVKTEISVPSLKPGEEGDVTAELTAPEEPDRYQSHWKLFDKGVAFGHRVWLLINVVPREILEPKPIEPLRIVEMEKEDETKELVKTEAPEEQRVVRDTETSLPTKSPIPLYRLIPNMLDQVDEQEQDKIIDEQPYPVNDLNKEDSTNAENVHSFKIDSLNVDGNEADKVELNLNSAVAAMERLTVSEPVDVPPYSVNKDLLSFEFLDRTPPKVSQTATPNNTPLDVSPPKSPILITRLETVLSASSSMELVNGDLDECAPLLAEYPHERIRSLEFRPDVVDDVESLDSYSDDDSSCSDDFFVVPLPDCFDTNKPLTRSMLLQNEDQEHTEDENQNEVVLNVQPSVDEMLSASASVDIQPLTPEVTSPEIQRGVPDIEASSGEDQTIINISDGAVGESVESQPLDSSCYAAASGRPLTAEEHQTRVLHVDTGCSQAAERIESSASTSSHDASASSDTSAEQQEFAKQLFDVAITTAATAASNAYFKVKEVIHTWQAKDMERQQHQIIAQNIKIKKEWTPPKHDFKPPQSTWMPPPKQDAFSPPKSDWNPPVQETIIPRLDWTPAEDNYTPPQSTWMPQNNGVIPKSTPSTGASNIETTPMDQLIAMGFCNRELNKQLLRKHDDDVSQAITSLLEMHNDNWASKRH